MDVLLRVHRTSCAPAAIHNELLLLGEFLPALRKVRALALGVALHRIFALTAVS